MLVFTADGSKLLVANEGERDDAIDAPGSVSMIDLSNGVLNATAQTTRMSTPAPPCRWQIRFAEPAIRTLPGPCSGRPPESAGMAPGRADSHCTRARPAAAVRRRKGLVQVHVDDIEALVPRPYLAEDRVQIRAVVIQQPACGVNDACDFFDARRSNTPSVDGFVSMMPAVFRPDRRTQRFDIHVAVFVDGGSHARHSRTSLPWRDWCREPLPAP